MTKRRVGTIAGYILICTLISLVTIILTGDNRWWGFSMVLSLMVGYWSIFYRPMDETQKQMWLMPGLITSINGALSLIVLFLTNDFLMWYAAFGALSLACVFVVSLRDQRR